MLLYPHDLWFLLQTEVFCFWLLAFLVNISAISFASCNKINQD